MEMSTYCREQFNFELPNVILARYTSLFLDKLLHCDNRLTKNVMQRCEHSLPSPQQRAERSTLVSRQN